MLKSRLFTDKTEERTKALLSVEEVVLYLQMLERVLLETCGQTCGTLSSDAVLEYLKMLKTGVALQVP